MGFILFLFTASAAVLQQRSVTGSEEQKELFRLPVKKMSKC